MRVLVLDSNREDVRMLENTLRKHDGITVWSQPTLAKGLTVLSHSSPDVVLLDILLSDSSDFGAVSELKRLYPDIPIVVVTHMVNSDVRNSLIRKGIEDVVSKSKIQSGMLKRIIETAVARVSPVKQTEDVQKYRLLRASLAALPIAQVNQFYTAIKGTVDEGLM